MLSKLLKKVRVSEVHLCLPFVQVTMDILQEDSIREEATREESPRVRTIESRRQTPALSETVHLAVAARPATPEITVAPLKDNLYSELSFRVATEMDAFGPVFRGDWKPLSTGLELCPGDFIWLRLYCRNAGDRVLHNVRIALEGVDIAKRKGGIVVRGVGGWPRESVRDCVAGHELQHLNPGEDYSLHCILRVPKDILQNKKASFAAVEPNFTILKQLV